MSALPSVIAPDVTEAEALAQLAAQIGDLTELLKRENDGRLSAGEIALIPEANASVRAVMDAEEQRVRDSSRLIYERAYRRAVDARDAVRTLIFAGVPEFKTLPNGGTSGADGMKRLKLIEAIRTYATESRLLWDAAQLVCDVEELEDDGEADGIKWHAEL